MPSIFIFFVLFSTLSFAAESNPSLLGPEDGWGFNPIGLRRGTFDAKDEKGYKYQVMITDITKRGGSYLIVLYKTKPKKEVHFLLCDPAKYNDKYQVFPLLYTPDGYLQKADSPSHILTIFTGKKGQLSVEIDNTTIKDEKTNENTKDIFHNISFLMDKENKTTLYEYMKGDYRKIGEKKTKIKALENDVHKRMARLFLRSGNRKTNAIIEPIFQNTLYAFTEIQDDRTGEKPKGPSHQIAIFFSQGNAFGKESDYLLIFDSKFNKIEVYKK